METKFTPGPWLVRIEFGTPCIRPADPKTKGHSVGYAPIAKIRGDKRIGNDAANATLMASAPDMLEALRITRGNVASLGPAGALAPYYEYREWLRMLDEVIAKATGGK